MVCPLDQTELVITERNGIEIDYCPRCRGVFLDRGELDKIIEQAATRAPRYDEAPRREPRHDDDYERRSEPRREERHYGDDDYHNGGHHGKHHKKESFLGELFDF